MQRKKYMIIAILVVVMLVSLDVKRAIDHPEMDLERSEEPLVLVDGQDLLERALAEEPAPRTPVDLRQLVIDLQNATPIVYRTDYDNDLLYDSVEKVIGTDPTRNDTDSDQLSDYFEAMNGTDPIYPDSNFDGIFDFDEVNVALDLDLDDIPNAWDFDNDGDGVNDDSDISPFACSEVMDEFNIQIKTDGMPTLINIQLTPGNVEHLKLLYQTWNWPLDEEGIMQDHDDSTNDLSIHPFLRIITDEIPSESALNEMNVISTEDGLLVTLTPVLEYDTVVAFTGRLLYNDSVPTDIDLTAELVWKIDGDTDILAENLKANDEYLSYGQDMVAICNVSDQYDALTLEWIHIREDTQRIRFALKILDGPYLTVAEDGRTLEFAGESLGPREQFLFYKSSGEILSNIGNWIYVNPDGTMVLQDSPRTSFERVDASFSSTTHLATYTEPFRISGITVEEFYGTDVGVFYNSTNKTHTVAANWFMTYRFVNNATTTLSDMPTLLSNQNVNISNLIASVRDRYEALMLLSNELFPLAMDGVPSDAHYPIIAAFEDTSKIIDLSQILVGSYVVDDTCMFDLTATEIVTSKSLKMNWYNTSTYVALAPVELIVEVALMNLSDMASANLLAILLRWDTGIHTITSIGTDDVYFEAPDSEELAVTQYVLMGTLEALNLGTKLIFMLKAWKELNIYVKNMASVTEVTDRLEAIRKHYSQALSWIDTVQDVGKNKKMVTWLKYSRWINANKNAKFTKFCKGFEKALFVVGVLVDIGLAIWAGFAIADQIGGQVGREFGTIYGITAAIIGILIVALLAVIEMIPVVGWLIAIAACIADAVGGYSTKLIAWLTDWIFGTPIQLGYTTPNAYLDDTPDIAIIDNDSNGFTVGDALKINGSIWREIDAYVFQAFVTRYDYQYSKTELAQILTFLTSLEAYVSFNGPDGANQQVDNMPTNTTEVVSRRISTYPFKYRTSTRDEFGAWIYPSVAMANYPITLRLHYPYTIINSWGHYVFPWFGLGGNCYHDDTEQDLTVAYDVTTFKYDVFPASLADFLEWSTITPNDPDGDTLSQEQETANGLSAWNYDSDGDNLNDRYELENGLDATYFDSDYDGVSDWYEAVYGTNATNSDTDEDGVDDFKEISGWVINFCYLNNDSLRFQIPVTSDPRNNDSDGDGIDDFEEFKANTNPRSNDTDGDGNPDLSIAWFESEAIYDTAIDITLDGEYIYIPDICVDEYGYVYGGGVLDVEPYNATIRKFDASLNAAKLPSNSIFPDMTMYPIESGCVRLEVDRSNDWIYAATTLGIDRFNLSGTEINPDSWSTLSPPNIVDFAIDDEGNIYVLRFSSPSNYADIQKYSSDGTLLATWGSRGPAVDQFDLPISIAVDNKFGFIYVGDRQISYSIPDRVVKLRLSDGAFLGVISENYDRVLDTDVDNEGYIYVLGENSSETTVQKFYPNGDEDVGFRFNGNSTHDFYSGGGDLRRMAISPDKSIYVLDWVVVGSPFTTRIWKFSQNVELKSDLVPDTDSDWDNDGLTNAQEIDGWEITVNFTSGELTFIVTSNHLMNDTDLDGLSDYLEYTLGSNPRSPDTDGDGASDHMEWWLDQYPSVPYEPSMTNYLMAPSAGFTTDMMWMGTGPSLTDWDTDGDLLGDTTEITFGSSPVNPDSDGEGFSDLNEFIYNSNPNSADSDNDGADDAYELAMNSSLLSADSDGDLIFDGAEYDQGTNPTNQDQDGDGILDGIELLYGSNPMSNDSDSDGIMDSVEVSLGLDVNNNDTDGDGVLDGIEIAEGTDPWLTDSDWDGIVDSEDPDTLNPWGGQIALVYDADAPDATIQFGELLGNYSYVTVFDADSFLDVSEDYQYVVLVGRPTSSATGTAGLVYDLLEDTGSMLTTLMDTNSDNIAVRYSVWNEPQTVVLMSGANTTDVFTVLQVLKYFEVSLLPDSVLVEFNTFESGHNLTVDYAFPVNTIEGVKATDAAVLLQLSGIAQPSIRITRYNATTTPHSLATANGLVEGDTAIGKYLDVSMTLYGTTLDVFESALILVYYRASDLDMNGNGLLGDIGDINETSLSLYQFDEVGEEWVKLTEDLSWVIGIGQNTTNIEVYGELYEGYIWVQVTELSLLAVAGQIINVGFGLLETVILIAVLGTFGIVAIVFVHRFRKRRIEGKQIELLSSLQGCLGMI